MSDYQDVQPTMHKMQDLETRQLRVSLLFRNEAHMENWLAHTKKLGYQEGLAAGAEDLKNRVRGLVKELLG